MSNFRFSVCEACGQDVWHASSREKIGLFCVFILVSSACANQLRNGANSCIATAHAFLPVQRLFAGFFDHMRDTCLCVRALIVLCVWN